MEKYKINGRKISMPSDWGEVKFKDGLHIISEGLNKIEIFSLLSGISKTQVKKLNKGNDIQCFIEAFTFLNSLPTQEVPQIPMSIIWKGKTILFPFAILNDEFDFGECSIGQIEDMKAVLTNDSKEAMGEDSDASKLTQLDMIGMMPKIVAIYIQPIIDKGEYDYKKAMKYANELPNEMSFKEVLLMGNFFLTKLTGLINGSKKGWRIVRIVIRSFKQVFWKLIRRLDSIVR